MGYGLGSGHGIPAGPARVLIVDDSRVVRAVVRGCLRSGGYMVEEASDGLAALQMHERSPYDVVVSDVGMPGLDGFALLKALTQRPNPPEMVLLTALANVEQESAERGVNLRAHECLTKPPMAPDTVVSAVERALSRKRARAA